MSTTTDQLGNEAKAVARDLQSMGGTVTGAAQEKLGQLRENASEYREQGLDKLRHAKRNVGHFLGGLPIGSVLIAAAIGLLLGRFWPRR
jgi:ElaB/YqjD/DUF883 family membrane-anchored ribosome-binding protein